MGRGARPRRGCLQLDKMSFVPVRSKAKVSCALRAFRGCFGQALSKEGKGMFADEGYTCVSALAAQQRKCTL